MTVSTSTNKVFHNGNSVATIFAYPYRILSSAHLEVHVSTDGSTYTLQTEGGAGTYDYTVTGVGDLSGGSVTFNNPPPTVTQGVLLFRSVPLTQISDYVNGDEFPMDVLEDDLDKAMMCIQQLNEEGTRSLQLPITSTFTNQVPEPVVSKALFTKADGTGFEWLNVSDLGATAVSAFMATVLDDATAADARTTLGAAASNDAALTGNPTAPTAARADNDTSVATTAFVQENMRNALVPIGASVAANALTVTLSPCVLDFRSATLTSGAVNTRTVPAAITLTVPSSATLGTINAQQSRLIVLAIDNAGTVELAVVNLTGGVSLDETGTINTTAISAGSTSASTVYSTSARTGVAYRVVGYIESTQATAGTWATAPSTIQGAGGTALASIGSLGFGQTWTPVTGSRSSGTTYYNTTGKPITLLINAYSATSMTFAVNGVNQVQFANAAATAQLYIVPAGASYSYTTSGGGITSWAELR